MVVLNEKQFIGKGSERACYIDPRDENKVIKVVHVTISLNNQNELDYIYMKYLIKKNSDLSLLPRCYGYVDTNLGQGLIFDRIIDFDLEPSKSFRYYMTIRK